MVCLVARHANQLNMLVLLAAIMDPDAFLKILIFLNVNPFQKPSLCRTGCPSTHALLGKMVDASRKISQICVYIWLARFESTATH